MADEPWERSLRVVATTAREGGWAGGRLLVVGDVMVDVVVRASGPLRRGSDTAAEVLVAGGGSAANTAAWVASETRPVALLAATGDDELGSTARSELARLGVRLQGPVVAGARTGTCVVLVEPTGERTMLPDRAANDHLDADAVAAVVRGTDVGWLHLSGYTVLHEGSRAAGVAALARARERGIPTSVDVASAGPIGDLGVDALAAALGPVDILFANEDEVAALGGEDAALDLAAAVVVKQGPDGATWIDRERREHVDAAPAEVVDTTGAGDAFAAGFLATWDGADVRGALEAGARLAASAVSRAGARPDPLV